VDSHPGSGTEFRIFFRALKKEDIGSVPVVAAPVAHGTERILIVEDDDAVRGLSVRILSGLGYQVVEARSPHEALQYGRDHLVGIDLILADVVLPEMSGSELVNRMRTFSPDVRVLYVTGFDSAQAVQHGVDPARDVMVMKPFSQEFLASKVRQVLDFKGV
jgi:DNA-binding response OmpR family regulator